jgi:hypothetical protein
MPDSALPGLVSAVPAMAELTRTFDVRALQADLKRLADVQWHPQRSYGDNGLSEDTNADWRCLPLRSVGGDPYRADPGGGGLEPFAGTQWLRACPYLAEVLDSIPAQLRGCRLMRLGAGVAVGEHRDGKYGLEYGAIRLHVPVTTNPSVVLTVDGHDHHWEPGTLWFADFQRPHSVRNGGGSSRVHIVIDTMVSPDLLGLFPADFLAALPRTEVLFAETPIPLRPADLHRLRCRFRMPAVFLAWSEDPPDDGTDVPAGIEILDSKPVLTVAGEPVFGLVHVGTGRFRLEGWSDERQLQADWGGPAPLIRMLIRKGSSVREYCRPIQPGSA